MLGIVSNLLVSRRHVLIMEKGECDVYVFVFEVAVL